MVAAAAVDQVPVGDNYFTALNSAVFSDGSFVFIPKGVHSPMELSTYFRINASETGQVSSHGTCMGIACAILGNCTAGRAFGLTCEDTSMIMGACVCQAACFYHTLPNLINDKHFSCPGAV